MQKSKYPLVSIITVCFNAEKTIRKTLESVNSQIYPNIEHLIIDGQSNDSTLAIVQQLATSRTHIVSEKDHGIYDAMNKGVNLASGEIIGFLNADDHFASPDSIECIVSSLTSGEDILWGYGITECVDSKTGLSIKLGIPPPQKLGHWQKRDLTICGCGQPSLYAKKQVFEIIGGFNTKYRICADTDWVIRLWNRYRPIFFGRTIVIMELGGASSNRKVIEELREVHHTHYHSRILDNLVYFRHSLGWLARQKLLKGLHRPYLAIRRALLRDR